jgi:hypothetical protein
MKTTSKPVMTAKERADKRKARYEARKVNACLCGCGKKVAGSFAQGHDQRVRGMLQRHELDGAKIGKVLAAAVKAGKVIKPSALADANQAVLA